MHPLYDSNGTSERDLEKFADLSCKFFVDDSRSVVLHRIGYHANLAARSVKVKIWEKTIVHLRRDYRKDTA
jgi:hypothetical protein